MSTELLLDKIRQRITKGDLLRLKVRSMSMFPTIKPGQAILIEHSVGEDLQIDDVIAFTCNEEIIVHRITELHKETFITKGDNNQTADSPCSYGALLGKVMHLNEVPRPHSQMRKALRCLILLTILKLRNTRVMQWIWSRLLHSIKKRVKVVFTKPGIELIHFHSRYLKPTIIPGSSDVDATLILENQRNICAKKILFRRYIELGLQTALRTPLFDPPYIFFKSELPEILGTSIYFRQSLGTDLNFRGPLTIHETELNSIVGEIDELLAITWRVYKLTTHSYILPSLTKIKSQVESAKIQGDLEVLSRKVLSSPSAPIIERPVSEKPIENKELERLIYGVAAIIIRRAQEALLGHGIRYEPPEKLESLQELENILFMILSLIPSQILPLTLNYGLRIRG